MRANLELAVSGAHFIQLIQITAPGRMRAALLWGGWSRAVGGAVGWRVHGHFGFGHSGLCNQTNAATMVVGTVATFPQEDARVTLRNDKRVEPACY